MAERNIGQHAPGTGSGAPGESTGQRGKLTSGVNVGQANGPDANMRVPAPRKDADLSTTTHSSGADRGETNPGADDKR